MELSLMMSFQGALMLRQFNVYRNTSAATRDQLPYYMLIQDDYYDDLPHSRHCTPREK